MSAFAKQLKNYHLIGWMLLLFALVNIFSIGIGFGIFSKNDPYLKLDVKPAATATLSKEPVKQFEGAVLYFKGTLVIKDLPWWKRTLLSKEFTDAVCFSILAILVLLTVRTLQQGNDFYKKIGGYIFYAALVFILAVIIDMVQRYWLKDIVLEKTNAAFVLLRTTDALLPNSMVAIILLIFSSIYTKAWQLKTEQALTI